MGHRVAVIVRTKNRPEFLRRALADIAAQTYDDIEVIVVNDGGVRDVVDQAVGSSNISRTVTILDTVTPSGRCAAANAGVNATAADYVVLHDDDDLWHPDFLADTVAWLDEHPQHGGVAAATEIVYEQLTNGEWIETSRSPFWEGMTRVSLDEMLRVNRIVPISFLYRRELHDELGGYDERLDAVEDWEFYLRVLLAHPIGFLPGAPRAFWMQRPAANGVEANSMFALASEHSRDDALVRDRALAEWIAKNGTGVPLQIAAMEKRLREDFARELAVNLERQRHEIVDEIYARHPLWRRLRKLRRRRGSISSDGP